MNKFLIAILALLAPLSVQAQSIPLGAVPGFGNSVAANAGGAASITSGTTTITGGLNTAICYDDGGAIKCDTTSPTWTKGTNTLASKGPITLVGDNTDLGPTLKWSNIATPTGINFDNVGYGSTWSAGRMYQDFQTVPVGSTGGGVSYTDFYGPEQETFSDYANLNVNGSDRPGVGLEDLPRTVVLAGQALNGFIIMTRAGPLRFATGGNILGNESWNITDPAGNLTSVGSGRNITASGGITSGVVATNTGAFHLVGTTSGNISILPQNAAGTYNFNLPTTAGSAGQVLTSQGGVATPMTWTTPSTGLAFPATVSGTTTSGGIPYFSNTTTLTSSGLLDTGNVIYGGGAGGAPTSEAAFNYDATNNRLKITGGTTATDNSATMYSVAGTLPASPSVFVDGVKFDITSAGSAGFTQEAVRSNLNAGYTGALRTFAFVGSNNAASTFGGPNIFSGCGNCGTYGEVTGVTAGWGSGVYGSGNNSTTLAVGVTGEGGQNSETNHTGARVGVLGLASGSTATSTLRNVAGYFTLNAGAVPITTNADYGLLVDGGTLNADGKTQILYAQGTAATVPTATQFGGTITMTGAGSASFTQETMFINLAAGYTGSSLTISNGVGNSSAGTGNTLSLGGTSSIVGNAAQYEYANGSSTGLNIGNFADGLNSTGMNIGDYGRAGSTVAGTNVGVLGNAANSTEGTNLKNVAGWFTLTTTSPAAVADNVSVALAAASDGTADIFRGYSTTTKNVSIAATGAIATASTITSSATGAIGWSVVNATNQACNTTCTSACVVGIDALGAGGFLACTDATADSCVCAGAS